MFCRKAGPIPRSRTAKTRFTTLSEDGPTCKSVPTTPRGARGQLFSSKLNLSIGSTMFRKNSKSWSSSLPLNSNDEKSFRRHPIILFLQVLFLKTNSLQDALHVLDHLRMPAQIPHAIRPDEPPLVGVLANQIVNAADLALPTVILPGTTHRENTAKPRGLFRKVFQFLAITEFPRPARAVQQK